MHVHLHSVLDQGQTPLCNNSGKERERWRERETERERQRERDRERERALPLEYVVKP